MSPRDRQVIAYFTMEVAVSPEIPTYSGGLGVLAGDHLRSAADLGIPIVGMSLLYRRGYHLQTIDANGRQIEHPVEWNVAAQLEELPHRIAVKVENRMILVRAWMYEVVGVTGFAVPVFFLDTDLPENAVADRELTHWLYGGDERYRLAQEVVLGIGGLRMLRVLGYYRIGRFHLNEGHAALLTLELLEEETRMTGEARPGFDEINRVRQQCVFTTHTPVPAGHDRFPRALVDQVVGPHAAFDIARLAETSDLNMTRLAIAFSRSINGVAQRHAEVSQQMFPEHQVGWITNGVHAPTWTAPVMQALFDRYTPGWREHPEILRNAVRIPDEEIDRARHKAKQTLFDHIAKTTGVVMEPRVLTLGFARRFTAYKRPTLLLSDVARLNSVAEESGDLQIVFSGKAHPRDQAGKELIRQVAQVIPQLGPRIKCVFLPNYSLALGALLISGVDVWLNTPQPPLEASGTSGMKAALNGVPSLSVVDGWWVEGCQENVTGWSIGSDPFLHPLPPNSEQAADDLYRKLKDVVLPTYYFDPRRFRDMVRQSIAFNGSFFNTHRMLEEYAVRAYRDW